MRHKILLLMKQRKTLVVQLVQHAHIHYTDALTWVRNKPSGGIVKARKIRVYLCYKVSKMFRRMIRQYANYIYQKEYDSLNVRYQYRKMSNIWKTKDAIGMRFCSIRVNNAWRRGVRSQTGIKRICGRKFFMKL